MTDHKIYETCEVTLAGYRDRQSEKPTTRVVSSSRMLGSSLAILGSTYIYPMAAPAFQKSDQQMECFNELNLCNDLKMFERNQPAPMTTSHESRKRRSQGGGIGENSSELGNNHLSLPMLCSTKYEDAKFYSACKTLKRKKRLDVEIFHTWSEAGVVILTASC